MSESVETGVLLLCTSVLEKAFASDSDLAHYLNKEGYLKDDDYDAVINPKTLLSKKEKANILVAGIRDKVALNSQRYHDFLKYLRLNPRKYGDIVDILDKNYLEARRSAEFSTKISETQAVEATATCPEVSSFDQETQAVEATATCPEVSSFDQGEFEDLDISKISPVVLSTDMNKHNITVLENYGLDGRTGYWWFKFTFDFKLENGIEVRLTNFKYKNSQDWTLEVTKCNYLGIQNEDQMESFDMADEFINSSELSNLLASNESLWKYLDKYIVPLVIKKIKYTKYKPQFCFYLSYFSENIPFMRTFENGFKFLGYDTWLKESAKPFGNIVAKLKAAIDGCDCFLPWIDEKYMNDKNCRAELLYAHKEKKIILPFGDSKVVDEFFTGNFSFMKLVHIYNPMHSSFFEVLQHIDDTLFNFEDLVL